MTECNGNIADMKFQLKEQMEDYKMMGREIILWSR